MSLKCTMNLFGNVLSLREAENFRKFIVRQFVADIMNIILKDSFASLQGKMGRLGHLSVPMSMV